VTLVPPAAPRPFLGWRMVGSACLVDFIAVGFFFYSFGVFYPAIAVDFAGASFAVALGISVSNFVSGLAAPFVGRALDRRPLKPVMLLGAVIVSSGFALLSLSTRLWQYYLVMGTCFAFGLSMMGGMASSKLVANWFVLRRGTALGFATMGVSLSGLVMPPLATWLVESLGWRGGFQVYSLGILAIVVPVVSLVVVTRPEEVGQHPDGLAPLVAGDHGYTADVTWSTRELLRTREFWVIALPFALVFSALSAILIHLIPYASDLGIGGYRKGWILSASAGSGAIGKLVFGRLIDRVDPRLAVLISFGTQFVGLIGIHLAGGFTPLIAAASLFGFGMGGVVPLQGAIAGMAFGRISFGSAMGLMRPVQVPLHALGVPLAAWIHDRTGAYAEAWYLFLAVYAVSSAIILMLRVKRAPGPPPLAHEPGLL
jgi:MFS family permease